MRSLLVLLVLIGIGVSVTAGKAAAVCPGDVDGDGVVDIDEVLQVVHAALYGCPSPCPGDLDTSGEVTIDEVVAAVDAALNGCGTPTPTVTATPTPSATEGPATATPVMEPPNPLYVQVTGSDSNSGDQNSPLQTISKAAALARHGYQIIVGPGTYREGVSLAGGDPPGGLSFLATGRVIIDATDSPIQAGFKLVNSPGVVIDGFEIVGGPDAGIVVKTNSNELVVRNCLVHDNPGDGIRIQDSAAVTLFNNLITYNGSVEPNPHGRGIAIVGSVSGSPFAGIINNTIVGHYDRGITIGTTTVDSRGAYVHNNILQFNARAQAIDGNLRVFTEPRSDLEYTGDFNLVFAPDVYFPAAIKGEHDINADVRFVNEQNDFHLDSRSPAIDAGDPTLAASFAAPLRGRTTTGTGLDSEPIDLGYHYLP